MKNLAQIRGFKNSSIGTIMSWTGTTGDIPVGWMACDGTTLNDADYPALLAVIGYTYGGSSGSSTFVLPNLNGQNRVPVHKGAAYATDTGGATNTNITLNATWSIDSRPNKVVSFSPPQAIQSTGPGGSIWSQTAKVQPRVLSHENLPAHNHAFTIQNCNNQLTGNPSAESGGNRTDPYSFGNYTKGLIDVGAPNDDDHNTRYGSAQGAHTHGFVQYSVERGSIQISPYTRQYDETNSTVALNNNPGVGNSQLTMTPPYQSAIYIIKAF